MSEEQRMIIAKVVRATTKAGKPVVDLYTNNARLEYPELRLFELSELFLVGIDPNSLVSDQEVYCRFWAYYVESDKRNKNGNPYKDVVRLEPIETRPAAADDDESVLAELQKVNESLAGIHRLLEIAFFDGHLPASARQASAGQESPEPTPQVTQAEEQVQAATQVEKARPEPPEPTSQVTQDEGQVQTTQVEETGQELPPALNEDQARRQFSKIVGPAIREGKLSSDDVNALTRQISAGALTWGDALRRVQTVVAIIETVAT